MDTLPIEILHQILEPQSYYNICLVCTTWYDIVQYLSRDFRAAIDNIQTDASQIGALILLRNDKFHINYARKWAPLHIRTSIEAGLIYIIQQKHSSMLLMHMRALHFMPTSASRDELTKKASIAAISSHEYAASHIMMSKLNDHQIRTAYTEALLEAARTSDHEAARHCMAHIKYPNRHTFTYVISKMIVDDSNIDIIKYAINHASHMCQDMLECFLAISRDSRNDDLVQFITQKLAQ